MWRQLAVLGRSLLSPDSQTHVLEEYLRLWPALFAFTAKRLAIAAIALSPVAVTLACLTPLASRLADKQAIGIVFAPPQPLVVEIVGRSYHIDEYNHTIPMAASVDQPAVISVGGGRLQCATLVRKQAYASGWAERLLLRSLGFAILEADRPCHAETHWFLIRPSRGDANLLWPYLSDWEFDFFLMVCLASPVGLYALKSRS